MPWAAALASGFEAPNFDPSSPSSRSGTPTLQHAVRVVSLEKTDCEAHGLPTYF